MRGTARILVLSVVLLAAVLAGPRAGQTADGQCWAISAAGPIVQKEALSPAKDVHALALSRIKGRILSMSLCQEKGRFLYKLVVLGASGQVENLSLDARRPY